MSRVYGDPIDVWTVEDRPVRFTWRGQQYRVIRVHEQWGAERDWWRPTAAERTEDRHFWRLSAARYGSEPEVGVFELRYDQADGAWLLSRAWD